MPLFSAADAGARAAEQALLAATAEGSRRATASHELQIRELDELVRLAASGAERLKPGVCDRLAKLQSALTVHHARETAVLFPMMQTGRWSSIQHAICKMIDEHHQVLRLLDAVTIQLGLTGEPGSALTTRFEAFRAALATSIREEEQNLFLRFF